MLLLCLLLHYFIAEAASTPHFCTCTGTRRSATLYIGTYREIAPFAWPDQSSFIATYWEEAFKIGKAIIGVSMSKPHTSESNCRFFIYICIYICVYISVVHRSVNVGSYSFMHVRTEY